MKSRIMRLIHHYKRTASRKIPPFSRGKKPQLASCDGEGDAKVMETEMLQRGREKTTQMHHNKRRSKMYTLHASKLVEKQCRFFGMQLDGIQWDSIHYICIGRYRGGGRSSWFVQNREHAVVW